MLRNLAYMISRLTFLVLVLAVSGCSWLENKPAEKPTDIYLQLGVRYMDLNKLELAKENLQKAIEKDSQECQGAQRIGNLV